jgi:hypothetical protein
MHAIQDLFLESFSYELQFDMHFYMHSYLHKIFILVKSGCYTGGHDGVSWEVAERTLNIKLGSKPIKQGMHRFNEEKRMVIGEELVKFLTIWFFKEVQHPDWIANPVLVPKKNGKWMMCVDYTSPNKACPKDMFLLPRIDQVIDLTIGCELLSFLDAYSGYHPIPLSEMDQSATTFITPFDCLLWKNVIRTEKRGGYISAVYAVLLQ